MKAHLFTGLLLIFCGIGKLFALSTLQIEVKQQKILQPFWQAPIKAAKGSIIMVQGGDPAYGSICLYQLADQLVKSGWSVLLINSQLAVTTPWLEQLPPSIIALQQKNKKQLVIIHYGTELQTTLNFLLTADAKPVNGLILLSAFDLGEPKTPVDFQKITLSIYDIVGQFDYLEVQRQFILRQQAIQTANYKSLVFFGAAHDYIYSMPMLARYLDGWMKRLPAAD